MENEGGEPTTFGPDAAPQVGQTPTPEPQTPQLDPRVLEQVGQIQQQVQEMAPLMGQFSEALPLLEQLTQTPQEPEVDPIEEYAQAFAEQLSQQAGYDEELQGGFAQGLQQVLSQVVGPLQAEIAELRSGMGETQSHITRQQIDALEQSLPGFQDPEIRQSVAEGTVQRAAAFAQQFGGQAESVFNRLTQSPEFLRLNYYAQMGERSAASESPAGAEQEVLEPAGGASPGGGGVDEGDSIVAAGNRGGWNPG